MSGPSSGADGLILYASPLNRALGPLGMADRLQSLLLQPIPGGCCDVEQLIVVLEHPVAHVVAPHNCHTRSTGFSSGEYGGRCSRVRFAGTFNALATCQPARSST